MNDLREYADWLVAKILYGCRIEGTCGDPDEHDSDKTIRIAEAALQAQREASRAKFVKVRQQDGPVSYTRMEDAILTAVPQIPTEKEEDTELTRFYLAIEAELVRAKQKFPTWPADKIHAVGIMVEEAGEAMRAALQLEYENGSQDALYDELVQTGAMVIRCLENLTQPP